MLHAGIRSHSLAAWRHGFGLSPARRAAIRDGHSCPLGPLMTPRDMFILALEGGQPPGRVPHFELVFFLTMEAFGRVHPSHRRFDQWGSPGTN